MLMKNVIRGAVRYVANLLGRFRSMKGYQARIQILRAPGRAVIAAQYPCRLRVTNVGTRPWTPGGLFPVRLGAHWRLCGSSEYLVADDGRRVALPHAIEPGQHVEVTWTLTTPNGPGRFSIEFDLIREHVGWFGQSRYGVAQFTVDVEGRRAIDGDPNFNYDDFYARVDLDSDYWTVVGPSTREEFEALGRGKQELLVAQGLKPSSRVLDVGCGTGQLTWPMAEYLGPDGLYYGTDIAQQAVDFCRRRFPQGNFHFLRNGMTTIPLTGVQFDFIYLGSVFTHMYPEEIQAMLIDFTRLLAPGGAVIADAFVSQIPTTHSGSRNLVEINEEHLYAILRTTGYKAEVLQTLAWTEGVRRPIFKLTRRAALAA
jgi:SAM-dependent methyltransferase